MDKEDKEYRFREIRAYRVGWLLLLSDYLITFPVLSIWAWRTTKKIRLEYLGDKKQIKKDIVHGAFFMTNHRDIVLDAAWLSMLTRNKFFVRPFIGVGNNLFVKRWIEILMRFNRCFAVKRNGGMHEQLENAKQLSAYIKHLRGQGKSIWLAQREGRAKDGNDLTQPSVLHMLTLDGDNFFEEVKTLNICPVSISYEYDPCDYLKAAEMQLKRDNPNWKKSKKDDLKSMHTGIRGEKGQVVYRFTPSINPEIDALLAEHPEILNATTKQKLQAVCDIIDRHIHQGYEIYERGKEFDEYIESRLALIDIPNKDEIFLRAKLYEMYNFPVINHRKSLEFKV